MLGRVYILHHQLPVGICLENLHGQPMTRISFSWQVSDDGQHVREKLDGTELVNTYGPMPKDVVDSFIKARRAVCHRVVTRSGALQIFEPRPQLLDFANRQGKPRYDA